VQVASGNVVPPQPPREPPRHVMASQPQPRQPQLAKCSFCSHAAVNKCQSCNARICVDHIRMTMKPGWTRYDQSTVPMCPTCGEAQSSQNMAITVFGMILFVVVMIIVGVTQANKRK
jgi:hypothetical protein